MIHFPLRDRSTVLTSRSASSETRSVRTDAAPQLGVLHALAQALTVRRPFLALIGGIPSEAARLVDQALGGLPQPNHIAKADALREAPLTLATLIERILDREPGSLRSNNIESAVDAMVRSAGPSVRRILVIDKADYAPKDVLGYLALLTTLLGSDAPSFTVVLIGTPGFLRQCPPAIARRIDAEDVVDLRSFPDFPANLLERALLHAAVPSAAGSFNIGSDGWGKRGRLSFAKLGLVLLLAAAPAVVWLGAPLRRGAATSSQSDPLSQPKSEPAPSPEPAALTPSRGDPTEVQRAAVDTDPTPSPAVSEALIRRGNAAMEQGDITAARLLFERAATGSAVAAIAEGKTYDPDELLQAGARGVRPDRSAAEYWYRRAMVLGDPRAAGLLERLRAEPHDRNAVQSSGRASQP